MPITQQQFMNGPSTPGGTTVSLDTTDTLGAGIVGTTQIAAKAVNLSKVNAFMANGKTGTGSSQSIAHGLGATPTFVTAILTGSTASQAVTYGTHTSTNIVVTVTTGATFDVIAFA